MYGVWCRVYCVNQGFEFLRNEGLFLTCFCRRVDVNKDMEPQDQRQYTLRFTRLGDPDIQLCETDAPFATFSLPFDQWLDGVVEEGKEENEQEKMVGVQIDT